ncbi:type I secretion system permease/ATPase [Caenimonas koreensis DSM 17982]|uniref:Cyclolysin secretion/processing ATP-binding protein CyaB n=1 Tax=Caenimonas koreensis DSM 17982 TaxID=1121255 RepID=A0A844B5D6_9BURK|nr:type I secretion system permease/ATPase [Caenimonas koreensis]MRD48412.1 type I secretion system permease/ATPase [Caenimonas koreensis DSM 17982]
MGDVKVPFDIKAHTGWDRRKIGLSDANLQSDPLLDCLVELARIHGRSETRAGLSAGLPLNKEGLTPSLFVRAAGRAGLSAKVVRRTIDGIDVALLPVVLLLNGDSACLLIGWEDDGATARLLFPETGQGVITMPRADLEARYAGIAIFAHPQFRFDRRTPELLTRNRHWFWGAFRDQLPLYRDVLIAALLINIFALAFPLFSMNIYDRVVPNFATETLWMLAVGLALMLGADYTLRLMRGHFVDMAGARIDLRLSALIMERVLGMKLEHRPASVGAYAATLRSFESLRDFVASATVTAIIDLPFALLFLIVIAWICWPLVFVPIIGLTVMVFYAKSVAGRMRELSETTFRAGAMRNATIVEALTALETIKAHGSERVMQTKLESTAAFLSSVTSKLRLLSSSVTNGAATLQQAMNLILIVAGVYLIHDGWLTMGGMIAITMLAGRALQPLSQVVALMMQYENASMAMVSLEATMSKESERPATATYLHRPDLKGDITFDDVHFSYPGRKESALRGVSFRINAGEKVVVIGRVGSGKTTLQRLALGLYVPTKGTVSIDGVDIRQLDPVELRRNIGYVEQDAMLFYGTLRENISISAPLADDGAILAAAAVGGLSEMIDKHPQGFDMVIGERGESLSGGQRQGIAIARAALLDAPMLLLDEPTGSMDFSTEAQFKERLRVFAQHRTVLIVTHRNSLLELADRIIVLDEGIVVADGPREKVLDDLRAGRVGKAS